MSSPFLSSADWYNHPTPTNNNSNSNRSLNQSQPLPAPSSHSNLANWSDSDEPIQRSSSPFNASNHHLAMNTSNSAGPANNKLGTIGGHRSSSSSGPPSRQGSDSPAPLLNPNSSTSNNPTNPTISTAISNHAGSNSPFGLGLNSNSSTESVRQNLALNAFRNANTSSPMSQAGSSGNTKQTPINHHGNSSGRNEGSSGNTSNGYVTAHSQVGSSSYDSTVGGVGGDAGFNRQAFGSPYLDGSAPYSPALSGFGTGFGGGGGGGSNSVYTTPRLGFDFEPIGSIGNNNSSNASKRLSSSSYDQVQLNARFEPKKSFPSSNLGGAPSSSLERKDSMKSFKTESAGDVTQVKSKDQLNKSTLSNHEGSFKSTPQSSGTHPSTSNGNTTQSPTSTAESFPTSNSGNGKVLVAGDGKENTNADVLASHSIPRSNSSGSYPFPPSSTLSQSQQQRGNSTPLLNVPLANSSSSSNGHSLAGGLLSPTAATVGSTGPNTIVGPASGLQSPSGWQSPTPFSLSGNGGTSSTEFGSGSSNAFDALARSSPLVTDILDRLVKLETSVRDVNRQMGGVVRNVSLLIDRTRHLPQQNNLSGAGPIKSPIPAQGSFSQQQQQQQLHHQPHHQIPPSHLGHHHHHQQQQQQQQPNQRFSDMGSIQQGVHDVSMGAQSTNEDVRLLSNQLSHLSSSVAQLISGGMNPAQQQQALAGLGLAGNVNHNQSQPNNAHHQFGTPQSGLGVSGNSGPARDRMVSPLMPNASSFGNSSPHLGPSNGFPQAAGNRLSWGAAGGIAGTGGGPGSVGMSSPHLDGMPTTSSNRGLSKELAERRWSGMAHQSGGPTGTVAARSLAGGEHRRDSYGINTTSTTPNLSLNPNLGIRTPDIDGPPSSRFNDSQQQQQQQQQQQGVGGGNSTSTSSSALVTKWEGLPLHQDLLRSILKYGLGPPNKIQQRALPFLLRGNDIIAQAPPTQERIASYVIPALQLVLSTLREPNAQALGLGKGPIALIIGTTVDQATQAQRMVLGLGASLGIRVHIAAAASIDATQEAIAVAQSQPHIIVGTPRKMSELFQHLQQLSSSGTVLALSPSGASTASSSGQVSIEDVRLVVLDEADQLIARNLSDHVSTLLNLLPLPRSFGQSSLIAAGGSASPMLSPSPRLPNTSSSNNGSETSNSNHNQSTMDRQLAIFSNTVPQDVLNFAQSIHLRESVRVLVRREGSTLPASNPSGNASTNFGGGGGGASAPISISGGGGGSALISNHHHHQQQQQPQQRGHEHHSLSTSQPSNALGSSPMNSNVNPSSDPILSNLKGLRQYYLYVAVSTPSSANSPNPSMVLGSRMNHHETEMKLDVITDLLEDMDFGQLVVYTANANTAELVTYKLASRGIEALTLHRDMAHQTRSQTISKFRSPNSTFQTSVGTPNLGGPSRGRKALVIHDLILNPKEVHQIPLIVFYDLPKSVEEYKEKIACAASNGFSRPSVCVNVVTASGGPKGDIEMLRTLECHLGCKMAELPMDPKSILNF